MKRVSHPAKSVMYITDAAHLLSHNPEGREADGASVRPEHVVPIKPFLKNAAFGPEVISAMSAAFEDVCKEASGHSNVTKETIAAKIIQLAQGGETDPIILRETTLSELGLSQSPEMP